MSLKGGQDGVKDGGAHGGTHDGQIESDFFVSNSLFDNNNDVSSEPDHVHLQAPARCIQNGGQDNPSSCSAEDLQLLSECESQIDTSDTVSFNYDRGVVETNIEWLKSRCRNLEGVDFDSVVVAEHGSSSQNRTNGAELLHGAISSNIPRDEDGGGIALLCSDKTRNNINGHIIIKSLDMSDSDEDDSTEDNSDHEEGVTVHFNDFSNVIKNGNPEVFPLQILELQDFAAKNEVSLMTPQELESLPNRGLEFEDIAAVTSNGQLTGTNSLINPISSIACSSTNNTLQSQSISSNSVLETHILNSNTANVSNSKCSTKDTSATSPNPEKIDGQNVSQSDNQPVPMDHMSASPSTSLLCSPAATLPAGSNEVQSGGNNLTLATISISTDKTANSTQILVNTNQGQQLYLINTADLTQATNALQPLAQPANKSSSEVRVVPPSTAACESASDVSPLVGQAAALQPMPLQIQSTGYLLVPVGQQDGRGNGLLMSTPLAGVPAEVACQSRKVWICSEKGCEKIFRKLSKLKIHQMRHTGERPYKCSKHGCDWAFTTAYKLKRHEESHEGRKDYNCDFAGCGRKFTTVYNLNSHRKLHERPCTEQCPEPECRQSFPTKRQLDLHVRSHTGMEKTYKCPVAGCDKVFFSPNCMGSHTRVHLQDRQDLTCKFDGCGKVFDKLCRLKQHERRHTGEKPYLCEFEGCTWAFATASKLKRHKAKHTGLRKWVCSVCNKGFMRAEHLKGHLVTHSGVKPFVCPVQGCKARFTAKSSLYVHLKKHDESGKQITYHCPMEGCVRNYTSKAGLRNHILKHCLSTPSGTDPSNALDWVPLLGGDDDSVDSLVQNSPEGSAASNVSPSSGSSSVLSPAQERTLTSADFINTDGASGIPLSDSDLSPEQLSSTIVSQLIASSPLHQAPGLDMDTDSSKLQPKIAIATDAAVPSTVALENSSGSARTDYRSNHILSDRAKRRWHRLRDGEIAPDTDMVQDASFSDCIEKGGEATPSSPLFAPPDILSSQGVMFRDPETGITYVQTQLLQDDPPHPGLYSDDGSSPPSSVGAVATFTGTTINLQDLK